MRIKAPELSRVEQWIQESGNFIVPYPITVVTDAFISGGLHSKYRVNTIRVPSIQGHLRFWWRATRGAEYTHPYDLKARERLIFGDTSLPSPLRLTVACDARSTDKQKVEPKSAPSYVLFPYRDKDKSRSQELEELKRDAKARRGLSFVLSIRYSDAREYVPEDKKVYVRLPAEDVKFEVEAALWAWINFGGIGARTRRGCGSLYSKDFSPEFKENNTAREWLIEMMAQYKLPSLSTMEYREWPILAALTGCEDSIVVQNTADSVIKVWDETISAYSEFRQRRNTRKIVGDDGKPKIKPRRSHWPEPDALRRITGWSDLRHRDPYSLNIEDPMAFPRAQFGMPITFWFKDHKDPLKTELTPAGKERLASPLILKPLAVSESQAFGAIIRLIQPPLTHLRLRYVPGEERDKGISPKRIHDFKEKIKRQSLRHTHLYPRNISNSHYPLKNSGQDAITGLLQSEEVERWTRHQEQLKPAEKISKVWNSKNI